MYLEWLWQLGQIFEIFCPQIFFFLPLFNKKKKKKEKKRKKERKKKKKKKKKGLKKPNKQTTNKQKTLFGDFPKMYIFKPIICRFN